MTNRILINQLSFVAAGVTIGIGVGMLITEKTFKAKYKKLADEEIESVKESYKLLRKEGPDLADPTTVINNLYTQHVEELKYATESLDDTIEHVKNAQHAADVVAFATINDRPMPERDPENPYVISIDQFMTEADQGKISVTYYELDDVLIDDNEDQIPDINGVLGDDWLNRFGQQSHDPDMVYVRNEALANDFEVTRDPRSYKEVHLGYIPDPDENPKS